MSIFVSPAELRELLSSDEPVRLLDVRWTLAEPDGHDAYLRGHLPDAVWVDLSNELARHGTPQEGRHPLPHPAEFQEAVRRWGIDDGDAVVVYDDANGLAAARAWWLLRRAGITARVLDGGLRSWISAGGDIAIGDVAAQRGTASLQAMTAGVIDIDEAAVFPVSGVLIDARAAERYRGEVEPLDPVPGHIPGAVNVPLAALVDDDGMLKDTASLRAVLADVGVGEGVAVAAYCGSGVTAAHTVLVLAELGLDADLFPGSWSAWSHTPGRPIAVGPTPAEDIR